MQATQGAIAVRERWASEVVQGARAILEGIASDAAGAKLDSLVSNLGNVFVKGRWAPINHTYDQALGSGGLSLVRDPQLRFLLGRYAEGLENVGKLQESVIIQYYGALEPYMVAHTDYAEIAWDVQEAGLVGGLFSTDAEALTEQREFVNLLNLKLELELEMLDGLRAARALSEELFIRLESH